MIRTAVLLACAGVGGGILLLPRQADALGPIGVELGGQVGAGTNPVGGGSLNPLGLGLGGRAGVTWLGFYGGVNVMDYLGSGQSTSTTNASAHSFLYGVEVGYDLKVLGIVTIRPQLGVGDYTIYSGTASCAPSPCTPPSAPGTIGNGSPYLEPGAVGLVSFGVLYAGVDVNALLLPWGPSSSVTSASSFDSAFTAHAQVGVAF
jgi:hypothetical protein